MIRLKPGRERFFFGVHPLAPFAPFAVIIGFVSPVSQPTPEMGDEPFFSRPPESWRITAIRHRLLPIALALAACLAPPALHAAEPGPDPVLARVNGVTICASSLSCAMDALAMESPSPFSAGGSGGGLASSHEALRRTALERLIDLELLFQEGLKRHGRVVTELAEEEYRQEVARMGGAAGLSQVLKCGGMCEEDLKRSILRDQTIRLLLKERIFDRVEVSPQEVEAYYRHHALLFTRPETVRLQHILLTVREWDDSRELAALKSRMEKIRREANAGADFAALARRWSTDALTASRGGELGTVARGSLPAEFETVVTRLAPGQVGPPVPSRSGLHLLRLVDRHPMGIRPLEEVRGEILAQLRQEKAERLTAELLSGLRRSARIEILAP